MHEADKETIHLHAACIILNFAKFSDPFEFLVMLSWSRITYTPLPLAKSSTPEDSMSIPSTLPYSFYAPHSIGISPKFFSKKGMSYEFKKKMMAHESPWKNGHMKIYGSRTWLAMPKIIRRERPYMEHFILAFHSIHHISIHMHFSIMVVWLDYSFGFDLWLCKIFETSMPRFSPYHELYKKPF